MAGFKLDNDHAINTALARPAQQKLRALWMQLIAAYPSGVSSTSTTKYKDIVEWFAGIAGCDENVVYATGAAKKRASNLDTRLVQGDQVSRHTHLGLAFLQTATLPEEIKKLSDSAEVTAKKFLGSGPAAYDIIAVIIEYNGTPLLTKLLHRPGISPDLLIKEFPDAELVEHEGTLKHGSAAVGAAGAITATPAAIAPLNLILCGVPGCGKTHYIEQTLMPQYRSGEHHRYRFITFHPSYSYEEFVEGIKPEIVEGSISYKVVAGVFKEIALQAQADSQNAYAIFIDEINRGNIASIFGELMTLIELPKRGMAEVTLAYSRETFAVPPNLHIIGTMNTADRSIATLDIALRRRFQFKEIEPDPRILEQHLIENGVADATIEGVFVPDIMNHLNERLEFLLDRDHKVGHSYFMGVRSLEDLANLFEQQIIPLLHEYFFGDFEKICHALGESSTKTHEFDFIEKNHISSKEQAEIFGEAFSHLREKLMYRLKPTESWTREHFLRLAGTHNEGVSLDIEGAADTSEALAG